MLGCWYMCYVATDSLLIDLIVPKMSYGLFLC